jgi:sec-independent protein translocase protein TatA
VGADQPIHWIILVVLAGLLFGGYKKLPEMARSAGRSMRVFKTELKGLEDDDQARANAAQPNAYTQPNQAPPTQPVPTAQPAAPAQYAPAAQPAVQPQYAAPVEPAAAPAAIPAPVVVPSAPAADQSSVTAQSAYVPTEPVTDPTAPPRA